MAISPAYDFITKLSADMSGRTADAYLADMNSALGALNKIEDAVKSMEISTQDDFKRANDIKSLLCSLSCYTFNKDLPDNDRVWNLETELGKKMGKWTQRILAKGDDNLMIRYILWNKRYVGDKVIREWILQQLLDKGYVKTFEGKTVLVGIASKVGDNVFTPDYAGRNHRNYNHVCLPQCYLVGEHWESDLEFFKDKELSEVPKIGYYLTYMRDGKGCARHPKITQKDWSRLKAILPAHLGEF